MTRPEIAEVVMMFSFEGADALRASEEVKVKGEELMCRRSRLIKKCPQDIP